MANHQTDWIPFDSEAALDFERLAPGMDPAAVDPDHHLWRNGRLWWIAFTVHRGHLQERMRFSLGTDDVAQARELRDRVFALYLRSRECNVSLRFASRRRREKGGVVPGEAA
jgi:hypothetical protein